MPAGMTVVKPLMGYALWVGRNEKWRDTPKGRRAIFAEDKVSA